MSRGEGDGEELLDLQHTCSPPIPPMVHAHPQQPAPATGYAIGPAPAATRGRLVSTVPPASAPAPGVISQPAPHVDPMSWLDLLPPFPPPPEGLEETPEGRELFIRYFLS